MTQNFIRETSSVGELWLNLRIKLDGKLFKVSMTILMIQMIIIYNE